MQFVFLCFVFFVRVQMIPPRGCAYICMVHRQDAFRARQKLSTGSFKIGSKVIKVPSRPSSNSIVLAFSLWLPLNSFCDDLQREF